jgi:predicted  nucleic acid-binding Zn-ribbon protein
MNVPDLALHHQRLDQRATQLRAQIERLRAQLAADPVAEALERHIADVQADRRGVELSMLDREREAEGRRTRLRGRERELMSGRVRNPTELMKLNAEVEHLKAAVREEEDATIELMERQEALEADSARLARELLAARERTAAAAPDLAARLTQLERDLDEAETERAAVWEQIPDQWREAYRRVASRHPDPMAEVMGGQCRACRVTVTSSGMQGLRRAALVLCENCGRILVVG